MHMLFANLQQSCACMVRALGRIIVVLPRHGHRAHSYWYLTNDLAIVRGIAVLLRIDSIA